MHSGSQPRRGKAGHRRQPGGKARPGPRRTGGPVAGSSYAAEPLERRVLLAGFTVNTFADVVNPADGLLSLREAVEQANGNDQLDVVTLPAGAYRLNGSPLIIGGDPDLVEFTVAGGGEATIDAQRLSGVLNVVNGGTVKFTRVHFTGGNAGAVSSAGGAIFAAAGTSVTVLDAVLSNNAAPFGGAVFTEGAFSAEGVQFVGNAASDHGGGVSVGPAGTVTLTNSTLTNNRAGLGGGGVANQDGTVTLDGITIEGGDAINGGALFGAGTFTLRNSTIQNNRANNGGGFLVFDPNSTVNVIRSAILGNNASFAAGGLVDVGVPANVVSSTIAGNTSTGTAGGIHNLGHLTLTNSTVSGNTAAGDAAGIGNEQFFPGANSLVIRNGTVAFNRADSDGNGTGSGGGIYNFSGPLRLDNTVVAQNQRGTSPDNVSPGSGAVDPASANNLVTAGSAGGLVSGVNGNIVGVSDAGLAPLANNGGPTQTHALLPGSPAVNNGNAGLLSADAADLDGDGNITEPLPLDQAGNPRVVGGQVDIGSTESQQSSTANNVTAVRSGSSGNVLLIIGDAAANNVTVERQSNGTVVVTPNAGTTVNNQSGPQSFTGIAAVQVNMGAGDDVLTVSGDLVSGDVVADGGADNDTLDASAFMGRATLGGGLGDDRLVGTSGDDLLAGGPGDDRITAGGGTDLADGGDGADELDGGAGNDRLAGGPGADRLAGGADDDRLVWNNGDGGDLMDGNDGNDTAEVSGDSAAGDSFSVGANGQRVQFQSTTGTPATLDIGTTESLTLNGLGGGDTFTLNSLAGTPVQAVNAAGGAGDDRFTPADGFTVGNGGALDGGNGADTLDLSNRTDPPLVRLVNGAANVPGLGNVTNLENVVGPAIAAVMRVALAGAGGLVRAGDVLRYVATISSVGATAAGGLTFILNPDPNTNLLAGSVTTTAGAVTSGNTAGDTSVAVNVGTLAPGTQATVSFEAAVDNPLATGVNRVEAQGQVQSGATVVPTDDPATPAPADGTAVPANTTGDVVVTGSDSGGPPRVSVFNTAGGSLASFFAYDPAFAGGARVATGDVNGDNVPDLIAGSGPGLPGGARVKVIDGQKLQQTGGDGAILDSALLSNFVAYDTSFTGGVFVAAGDVDGDGRDDVITGAGPGAGPHVKVFNGLTGAEVASFFAFNPAFAGGARVATGDVNGDGRADLVVGAGPGNANGHVKVIDGTRLGQVLPNGQIADGTLLSDFFAYPGFNGGVFVAAGDVMSGGGREVVVGAGAGGGPAMPQVKVFAANGTPVNALTAYPGFTGGVRVAVGDVNNDGLHDVITAPGAGTAGAPAARVFAGPALAQIAEFATANPAFAATSAADPTGLLFEPTAGFTVTNTVPAAAAAVTARPASFTVNFSAAIDPTTFTPSDLTVNGIAATGFTANDADTATFTFPTSPVTAEGEQTMAIAAGAVASAAGAPLAPFVGRFYADLAAPRVTAASPAPGAVVPPGAVTFTVTFSEAMNTAELDPSDVTLTNVLDGAQRPADDFRFDVGGNVFTGVFAGVPDGRYTLTLRSGTGQFADLAGQPLDGELPGGLPSGDGAAGGNFVLAVSVDNPNDQTVPALQPLAPARSLIHGTSLPGVISHPADTDSFTVQLDAGQTITVLAAPAGASGAEPTIELRGPGGTSLGTAAGTGGLGALLQSVRATAGGTYTVVVGGGAGSTGLYTLDLTLNAALETEAQGVGGNDTTAAAQGIDPSVLPLLDGAGRGAALGRLGTSADVDFYRFTASRGRATLALTSLGGGAVDLELLDASGAVAATGTAGPANVSEAIANFPIPAGGTYFVRVTGAANADYSLVVTSNAAFDLEDNSSMGAAQDLTGARGALGAIDQPSATAGSDWYRLDVTGASNTLRARTATPADGPGQFGNTLNPRIELYDPSGNPLASGAALPDGRNENLTFVGGAGTYYLRVFGEAGSTGEYFLGFNANTVYWDGGPTGAGTDFHDPLNWGGDVKPGPGDNAEINVLGNPTVVVSQPADVGSLVSDEPIDITAGGDLTLGADSTFNAPVTLSGTLDGTGSRAFTVLNWLGGELAGAGATTVVNGALNVTGFDPKELGGGHVLRLAAGATGTLADGTLFMSDGGGPSEFHIDGRFTVTNAADIRRSGFGGPSPFVRVGGTFNVNSDTVFDPVDVDAPLHNLSANTVHVADGALNLNGGGTHAGGAFSAAAGATLAFAGGTHDLVGGSVTGEGAITFTGATVNLDAATTYAVAGTTLVNSGIANFSTAAPATTGTFSQGGGTLGGAGTFRVTGPANWTGGTMADAGTTEVAGALTLNSFGTKVLQGGRRLHVLPGAAASLAEGLLTLSNQGGAPVVENDGTFDALDHADIGLSNVGGTLPSFRNDGTFNKTGDATNTDVAVPFHTAAGAAVNVTGGTLNFTGGGTHAGDFSANGGTLRFGAGAYDFNAGQTTAAAPGLVQFAGTTFNFNAAAYAFTGPAQLAGGTLGGTGAVSFQTLDWTGGTMTGPAVTEVSTTLNLTGGSTKTLQAGRRLRLLAGATANLSGGSLSLSNQGGASVFENDGTFNAADHADISLSNFGGALPGFQNDGTFNKTGAGTTTDINVPFTHAGTVNANTGTLNLNGGGTYAGNFNAAGGAPGGTLRFAGGTHTYTAGQTTAGAGGLAVFVGTTFTFDTPYAVTGPAQMTGGTLGGTALVSFQTLDWTGGVMTGAGVTEVSTTLNLTGGSTKTLQTGRRLRLLAGATANLSGGPFSLSNQGGAASAFENDGTFNATDNADVSLSNFGGTLPTFRNNGTFNKTGAGTATDIGVPFVHAAGAAVNVNGGTLGLTGGGSYSGPFAANAGGTLRFGAGTHAFGAGQVAAAAGGLAVFAGAAFNFNAATYNVTGPAQMTGGTLGGPGSVTFQTLEWTSGTMTGAATTEVTQTLNLTGGSTKTLQTGRRLRLPAGATANLAGGPLSLSNNGGASVLEIGGTFNATDNADISLSNFGGALPFIQLDGTLNKTGAGTTTDVGVPLHNASPTGVNVTGGTLGLNNGGTHTGAFNAAGGTLRFAGSGTHAFTAGQVTAAAPGLAQFAAGTFSFTAAAGYDVTGPAQMTGGTLGGTGLVRFQTLDWTGGTMTEVGVTEVSAALTLSGFATKTLQTGRRLRLLAGATGSLAGGSLSLSNAGGAAAVFENDGTFDATDNADINQSNSGGALPSFQNDGTFNKGGNATTTAVGVPFNNAGTVNVNAGTLTLSNSVTQYTAATNTLAGGAWLIRANATFNFPTGNAVRTLAADVTLDGLSSNFPAVNGLIAVAAGGRFALAGGRDFATTPLGGTFANGGTLDVGPDSQLSITGALTQSATGTLNSRVNGTAAANVGQVLVSSAARLDGTLAVTRLDGYTPAPADQYPVMTYASRTGTFADALAVNFPAGVALAPDYRATELVVLLTFTLDAVDDPATTPEGAAVTVDVTANDATGGGGVPAIDAITQPARGAAVLNPDGTITYTPAGDYFGPDSFTYTLRDGGGNTDTATVSVTVTPVNDAPSFTAGPDQTVQEDAGPQSVPGWATAISAGPANESGQALTFLVGTDNDALFATLPAIDPVTGALTFTAAPDATGAATVTVRLRDDGGTADGGTDTSPPQQFTVTVLQPAPRVTDVFVAGSAWTPADANPATTTFLEFLALRGLGDGRFGYRVGDGGIGSDELPWANLDTVSVRFDGPVAVPLAAVRLVGSNPAVAAYTLQAVAYDAATRTATFRLSGGRVLPNDRLLLVLDGDPGGVTGTGQGTPRLDGEFTSLLPSGDGAAGGDFAFRFNVLPGDVSRDGVVNASDLVLVRTRIGKSTTNPGSPAATPPNDYTVFHDVNGDGVVNASDLILTRNNVGRALPPGEPVAPAAAASLFGQRRIAAAATDGDGDPDDGGDDELAAALA